LTRLEKILGCISPTIQALRGSTKEEEIILRLEVGVEKNCWGGTTEITKETTRKMHYKRVA